jgi:NAD(P)-dependent dehydrogenase (short-subunit alcohol dehydrogenase family)
MESLALRGKTALVTGAARRVGRVLALALAEAGADVVLTYRTSQTEAEELTRQIAALGRRSAALACDVRTEASVCATLVHLKERFGQLDLLVNNAAIFETAPLDQLSLAQWDAAFETNTRGPFLMAREALPLLKAAHGRIVNIGSLGGLRPWATHAHYCASKAALHMLTEAMAKAFAPEISVNCVAPGFVDLPEERAQIKTHFAEKTPMRRLARPEEIAEAVLFFATGPKFITGQTLAVDGGLGLL